MNRRIFRMLLMFGPMIFRAVSKYMKKNKQAEVQTNRTQRQERPAKEEQPYKEETFEQEDTFDSGENFDDSGRGKPNYEEGDLL